MSMAGKKLFGTDGVRGITNKHITPQFIARLAQAIGTYFGEGSRILVGQDARAGSYFTSHIVIGTLLSEGIKVYSAGLAPTPALQYYVKERGFDGGIIVTASHNPPEYSGLKVILSDGVEASKDVEREIEELFWENKSPQTDWRSLGYDAVKVNDVIDVYVDAIIDKVDVETIKRRGFRVAVDGANSVGSLSTPRLLRKLGVKVYSINTEISHEPNRPPEPGPESLQALSEAIKVWDADFGVAHDGDADRAIYVDNEGNVIPGDRTAVLLCKHILANRKDNLPKRVITAVSSSTIVEEVLKEYGVEVVWTKVGSVGIARMMMKIGAMAGFEENGGFMFPPHQYVRDGGMSIALMLEYLSKERKSLKDEISSLPSRYLVKGKVSITPGTDIQPVLEEVLKHFGSSARVIRVDGIKVIDKESWFLIRPSGTEPIIRIFTEAPKKEEAEKLLNLLMSQIKQVLK